MKIGSAGRTAKLRGFDSCWTGLLFLDITLRVFTTSGNPAAWRLFTAIRGASPWVMSMAAVRRLAIGRPLASLMMKHVGRSSTNQHGVTRRGALSE